MDISQMVRDASFCKEALFVRGNSISTKEKLRIYVPEKYASKGLAYVGSTVSVLGIMLITTDDKNYGVTTCTTMVTLTPDVVESVMVEDEYFYRFTFEKGSVVFQDRFPKKDKFKVNPVFDYFYGYGHSPWWMTTLDLADLLAHTSYWNDMSIHNSQVTLDVLASQISRDSKDVKAFARHGFKRPEDSLKPANTVPLRNGSLNRSTRLTMISNTELKKGIRSAMLMEPVREEFLENLFLH